MKMAHVRTTSVRLLHDMGTICLPCALLFISPEQIKDAVALCDFFAWLEKEVLKLKFNSGAEAGHTVKIYLQKTFRVIFRFQKAM